MLACQLVSVGCEETHLLSVQWTGYGLRLCDWLSHLANWCAQFLLGALLVFLGCCSRCRPSPLLALLPAVSWPWVPAWGLLEPSRRGGENAQKTRKNGGENGRDTA